MNNDLKHYRCYEIFSQSTGVEIRATVKASEESGQVIERSGRVQLRFFKLTPKTKPRRSDPDPLYLRAGRGL